MRNFVVFFLSLNLFVNTSESLILVDIDIPFAYETRKPELPFAARVLSYLTFQVEEKNKDRKFFTYEKGDSFTLADSDGLLSIAVLLDLERIALSNKAGKTQTTDALEAQTVLAMHTGNLICYFLKHYLANSYAVLEQDVAEKLPEMHLTLLAEHLKYYYNQPEKGKILFYQQIYKQYKNAVYNHLYFSYQNIDAYSDYLHPKYEQFLDQSNSIINASNPIFDRSFLNEWIYKARECTTYQVYTVKDGCIITHIYALEDLLNAKTNDNSSYSFSLPNNFFDEKLVLYLAYLNQKISFSDHLDMLGIDNPTVFSECDALIHKYNVRVPFNQINFRDIMVLLNKYSNKHLHPSNNQLINVQSIPHQPEAPSQSQKKQRGRKGRGPTQQSVQLSRIV